MNVTLPCSKSSAAVKANTLMTANFRLRLELYARRRLSDSASVQDAVQATLEALLLAKVPFRGDSSYLTYATGILRHKISDALRERQRFVQFEESDPEGDDVACEAIEQGYLSSDAFTGPEQHAHALAIGRALHLGLQSLSARSRQTLLMREHLGFESDAIAAQLGLSKSNTWVLLCRAKQAMRDSLIGQGYGPQHA